MLEIKNDIEIEAPAAFVWSVLIDRESYHEWNPLILSQEGTLESGCLATMRINPGLLPITVPIIYRQVIENQELSWFGGPPLGKGFHYFRLKELPNGNTMLSHGEKLGPLSAALSWLFVVTLVKRKFKRADLALKKRCELVLAQQHVVTN